MRIQGWRLVATVIVLVAGALSGCGGAGLLSPSAGGGAGAVSGGAGAVSGGAGAVSGPHYVILRWGASTSPEIIGYNLYRGTAPGGPYAKVSASFIAATTYTDNAVQSGQTYYYVVTATSSTYLESDYSNEVVAAIP
jgi:hypothetical protein